MLDASGLFGFFGVVPAIQRAYEVASDAAEAFEAEFAIAFVAAAAWADIAFDNTGEATNWVAIDRMVN